MQLQSGTLLQGGKYKIKKILGQGGFGITYLATQKVVIKDRIGEIETTIKVAIKEFFMKDVCNRDSDASHMSVPSIGSKEIVGKFKQKFIKEANNISRFRHPSIVKVLNVFDENDTAYYVMEYIEGGSLQDYVKQNGVLQEAEALRYIYQIADALSYIHQYKMNHLDVKPGNILLDANHKAILIDFGLSKRYDDEGNQTSTTPVGISAGYAPMEQYKKGGVGTFSPTTDIYSLAATLYKLLTGNTPPDANDVFDNGLPALPASISSSTENAICTAMQPKRSDRPQSIREFLSLFNDNTREREVKERLEQEEEKLSESTIIPNEPNNTSKDIISKKKEHIYIVSLLFAALCGIGLKIYSYDFAWEPWWNPITAFLMGSAFILSSFLLSYLYNRIKPSPIRAILGIVLIAFVLYMNIDAITYGIGNWVMECLLTLSIVGISNGILLLSVHRIKSKQQIVLHSLYSLVCFILIWLFSGYLYILTAISAIIISELIYKLGMSFITVHGEKEITK